MVKLGGVQEQGPRQLRWSSIDAPQSGTAHPIRCTMGSVSHLGGTKACEGGGNESIPRPHSGAVVTLARSLRSALDWRETRFLRTAATVGTWTLDLEESGCSWCPTRYEAA